MTRITGNTVKSKIEKLSGIALKSVHSDGGNAYTVRLNNASENFKVCFAIKQAGYTRVENGGAYISITI
jgi:hypothetical protein